MVTKMKALGLSVVIVFMLLKTSHSQSCHKTDQEEYGCPFQQFSSAESWCVAESYDEPGFAFYIKPDNHFNGLIIRLIKIDSQTRNYEFSVYRDLLSMADKWYHIQLKSTNGWWSKKHYHLYIDGQEQLRTKSSLAQPSKFILLVNGSPFYSNGTCNPADFPAPRVTTPLPPSTSLATETPLPPSTLLATTIQLIFGKPWWVFVIIGVSFTIIISLIITAVVMIRKWKGKKVDETGGDKEEKGTIKMTTNNNDWQTHVPPPPPLNFCDLDDPANHIYDEPEDVNIEEHIYESMEDIRGPITFVDDNGGQSMAYHVATPGRYNIPNQPNNAWQTRRGSAHDSENSLYGYI